MGYIASQEVTVTNTTTTQLAMTNLTRAGMIFYVDIKAIGAGDTWTFKLVGRLPDSTTAAGSSFDISAVSAGLTATGATLFVFTAPFTTAGNMIPMPFSCVATRTVAGGAPTVSYVITAIAPTFL